MEVLEGEEEPNTVSKYLHIVLRFDSLLMPVFSHAKSTWSWWRLAALDTKDGASADDASSAGNVNVSVASSPEQFLSSSL